MLLKIVCLINDLENLVCSAVMLKNEQFCMEHVKNVICCMTMSLNITFVNELLT